RQAAAVPVPLPREGLDPKEVEAERAKAEGERQRAEEVVAALREKERGAARERERAQREKEEESRRRAEEDLERLRTEREAEQAKLVEALERERRARAQAERAALAPSPSPPPPAGTQAVAAQLERVQGGVWLLAAGARTPLEGPRALLPGEGLETSVKEGSATLTFADRTELVLGPGTELREVHDREPSGPGSGGKRLLLQRGRVTATVAKQPPGEPFILRTPDGQAKVLGTTLRLTVDAGGTRLEVTEGRVQLSRTEGKTAIVSSGHSATIAAGLDPAPKAILGRLQYEAALLKRPDLLFFEDFEQDAWKRHWSSPSETSRVTEDPALSLVGRRALEVHLKAGEKGSDGWHRLTLPTGSSRVHFRAYFYFPKDFDLGPEGGLSLLKLGALPPGAGSQDGMSLWADHRPSGRDFFSADLVLSRGWTLQFGIYHPDQGGPKGDWKECDRPEGPLLKPGRWHAIELGCQANDPGQKNGVLRAWVDGILSGEEKGLRFRDADSLQIREMALTGGGPPSPRTQSYFVDDVVVAQNYIGLALGDEDGVDPRPKR
ncbi:MAG TPA: FecR domain-containing protein, partial [Planctomycetota bacterium]|nr:FecR domain-containing protein [Planctomycetota bacterium]